jgi:hypothetical protein
MKLIGNARIQSTSSLGHRRHAVNTRVPSVHRLQGLNLRTEANAIDSFNNTAPRDVYGL